jgi:hypothetical protein
MSDKPPGWLDQRVMPIAGRPLPFTQKYGSPTCRDVLYRSAIGSKTDLVLSGHDPVYQCIRPLVGELVKRKGLDRLFGASVFRMRRGRPNLHLVSSSGIACVEAAGQNTEMLRGAIGPRDPYPPNGCDMARSASSALVCRKDSAGQKLAYGNLRTSPGRRSAAKLLSKDEDCVDYRQVSVAIKNALN